jgi:hypothetical protein
MSLLSELRARKREILSQITGLGDMRRGSVVEQWYEGTCKDGSVLRRGPYPLYTYKDKGKTVSRRLLGDAEVERYREQIGEFRRFQELSAELVEVSHHMCEVGVGQEEGSREKKRWRRSSRRSGARSKG